MATSHSIVLSNTFCSKEYPTNQGCEFTNQLNQPLDVSYGKWAVNLSEIVYEPNFWMNIRKPNTFFDLGISNFNHRKVFKIHIIFRDIKVQLRRKIRNYDDPIGFKVTLTMFTKNYPHKDDVVTFFATKENGCVDIVGERINFINDESEMQEYHLMYGPLDIPVGDVRFILAHTIHPIDRMYAKIRSRALTVTYWDVVAMVKPVFYHHEFNEFNYIKADDFVVKL